MSDAKKCKTFVRQNHPKRKTLSPSVVFSSVGSFQSVGAVKSSLHLRNQIDELSQRFDTRHIAFGHGLIWIDQNRNETRPACAGDIAVIVITYIEAMCGGNIQRLRGQLENGGVGFSTPTILESMMQEKK
jgi:hypothetical protein